MLGDDQVAAAARAAQQHGGDRIIDTSVDRDDGLDKCPRCGSTDIRYDIGAQALTCTYCRYQWNEANAEKTFGLDSAISELRGHTMASGTADVREDSSVVTLKCQGCGAEVVINADEQLQARCHWCRQTLSINTQIPNGSVPDAILPFALTKEQAMAKIEEFVHARRTFAASKFKQEFVADNVMGVYIPYMIVDGNMHALLRGTGEVTTRQYTVRRKVGKDQYVTETYYDADVYAVQRAFDILVDDLAVESAARYSAHDNSQATNNILNAVQPYDTQNAVAYNSNYLKGFTSERRDLNIRDVDDTVEDRFLAIARAKAQPTVSRYDRGVRWEQEGVAVRGTRWVAVYVPVWLYSYAESATGDSLVHYIAVNARNGNTMGSVPVSHPKIFALSCALGTIAAVIGAVVGIGWFLAG